MCNLSLKKSICSQIIRKNITFDLKLVALSKAYLDILIGISFLTLLYFSDSSLLLCIPIFCKCFASYAYYSKPHLKLCFIGMIYATALCIYGIEKVSKEYCEILKTMNIPRMKCIKKRKWVTTFDKHFKLWPVIRYAYDSICAEQLLSINA